TGERHEPARKTRALRAWQIEEQLVIEQNPLFQPIKSLLKVRPRCRFDGGSEHFEILVENLQVEFQFSQKHVGTIRARQDLLLSVDVLHQILEGESTLEVNNIGTGTDRRWRLRVLTCCFKKRATEINTDTRWSL